MTRTMNYEICILKQVIAWLPAILFCALKHHVNASLTCQHTLLTVLVQCCSYQYKGIQTDRCSIYLHVCHTYLCIYFCDKLSKNHNKCITFLTLLLENTFRIFQMIN